MLLQSPTSTQTCQRWLHVRNFRIICARLGIMPRCLLLPFMRHVRQVFSVTNIQQNFLKFEWNRAEAFRSKPCSVDFTNLIFSNTRGYLALTSVTHDYIVKLREGWLEINYPMSLISWGRLHFRYFQVPLMVLRANLTAKQQYRKDNMTFTFWPFMTQM